MIISEAEKNRIRKLHRELFILKEHGIGGMASVGSGFVNPQEGTGRVGKFLTRQTELAECGEDMDPMEENLAGYYDFGEQEISEEQNEEDIEEQAAETLNLKVDDKGDDPDYTDDGMGMFE